MSNEAVTRELVEVDPRITKVTQAWKRVKKLEKDITEQQSCIDEQYVRLDTAIQEAELAELEIVAGNDEFRKKYEHQRERVRRIRDKMKLTKESYGSLKNLLSEERDKLEDIDRVSKEEALPLVAGAKVAPLSEAWRDVPMAHLGKISKNPLTETVINKLVEAGYDTLGKLTDYKSSGSWYTDIDGIGKSTSDKIDDAIEQFFAEWNVLAGAVSTETGEAESDPVPVQQGDILSMVLSEVDGVPTEAVKVLEDEKILTLGDLQKKMQKMGEDAPLWLNCTVGQDKADQIRKSISILAHAA